MKAIYSWKKGFFPLSSRYDAQEIGNYITQNHEKISPGELLEKATDEESPLHDWFEWDDAVAAHEYRLQQASYVIRAVHVQYPEVGDHEPVRAFVRLNELEPHEYIPMHEAMENPPLRDKLIQQALDELRQWRQRYAHLSELADLFSTIDTTVA